MIIKYVTDAARYDVNPEIMLKRVERETESSVWISGRRSAKRTEFEIFHDTWEEAHTYLLNEAERKVEGAKVRLSRAESILDAVKDMKNKTDKPL